jgi:hypothetical protein
VPDRGCYACVCNDHVAELHRVIPLSIAQNALDVSMCDRCASKLNREVISLTSNLEVGVRIAVPGLDRPTRYALSALTTLLFLVALGRQSLAIAVLGAIVALALAADLMWRRTVVARVNDARAAARRRDEEIRRRAIDLLASYLGQANMR